MNSTEIFYNIIKNYCCTPDAFKQYRNKLLSLESTVLGMSKYVNKIRKISNTIQKKYKYYRHVNEYIYSFLDNSINYIFNKIA